MWLVRNGDSLTLVWQKLRTYSVAASVFLSKNKIFYIVCASPKSMPQRWWNLKNTFSFNIEETGKSVKPKKLGKKKNSKSPRVGYRFNCSLTAFWHWKWEKCYSRWKTACFVNKARFPRHAPICVPDVDNLLELLLPTLPCSVYIYIVYILYICTHMNEITFLLI